MQVPKPRGVPKYLKLLFALTVTYLLYEMAFNARLLDVAGGLATPKQIDSIQFWGRIISGLAVALALVGVFLMPHAEERRWSIAKRSFIFGFTIFVTVEAVFWGQKAVVDYLADHSTGAERNLAAHLTLLTHGLLTRDITLEGIDLDSEKLSTPEGKAFIAIFPIGAFGINNLHQKVDVLTERLVRGVVKERIGSAEHYYNNAYRPSAQGIRKAYNEYTKGSNELLYALGTIPDRQQQAWWRYVNGLKARRWTPATVPQRWWGRVRQDVQRDGVPVSPDWTPSDQQAFYAAVRHRVETEAWGSYSSAIAQQLGAGKTVPPGLDLDSFVHQPAVQDKWRHELGVDPLSELRLGETVQEVTPQLYAPTFNHAMQDALADYEAGEEALGNSGSRAEFGRNAMRAVLVPPIALGLSLMGMIFHLAKFSDCLIRFLPGTTTARRLLILPAMAVVVVSVFFLPNAVSKSDVFASFQRVTATAASFKPIGRFLEVAITWTVQAQPYAYPINEAIRKMLPGQPGFGYEPRATVTPADADDDYTVAARED